MREISVHLMHDALLFSFLYAFLFVLPSIPLVVSWRLAFAHRLIRFFPPSMCVPIRHHSSVERYYPVEKKLAFNENRIEQQKRIHPFYPENGVDDGQFFPSTNHFPCEIETNL